MLEERLYSKLKRTRNGCLEWQGHRDSKGYGKIRVNSTTTDRTHRVALRLSGTPVGPGVLVRHFVCDNPPCCNPEHLLVGTSQDNVDDMISNGRHRWANGSAKLTERKVRNIREKYSHLPIKDLSQKYGVSQSTIRRVLTGQSWA